MFVDNCIIFKLKENTPKYERLIAFIFKLHVTKMISKYTILLKDYDKLRMR